MWHVPTMDIIVLVEMGYKGLKIWQMTFRFERGLQIPTTYMYGLCKEGTHCGHFRTQQKSRKHVVYKQTSLL